jgi:hypothetical protein
MSPDSKAILQRRRAAIPESSLRFPTLDPEARAPLPTTADTDACPRQNANEILRRAE